MLQLTIERFNAVIGEINEKELSWRREYHARLREGGNKTNLQEYLDEFADFASFGTPAGEATIQQAQQLSSPVFPQDLIEFYRTMGSFKSSGSALCNLNIFALERLIEQSASEDYGRLFSMGIVDMIRYLWGNDRPELEPESDRALVSAEDIAHLNGAFTCVGYWQRTDDIGESHDLIYFDREGRFGTLYVHQDYFDILHLLDNSPATQDFDEVLNENLDRILCRDF